MGERTLTESDFQLDEVELSSFLSRYFALQVPLDIFPGGHMVMDIELRGK
jgi:hypothetical protein